MLSQEPRKNFHLMSKPRDVIYTTPKKINAQTINAFNENETEKTDSFKSSSNGFSDEIKSETTEIVEKNQKKLMEEKKKKSKKNIVESDLYTQAKSISKILDIFSEPEKSMALTLSEEMMMVHVRKEIDCIGCFYDLEKYIQNTLKIMNKSTTSTSFNLYTYGNFGLSPKSSNNEIAQLLAELKVRSDVLQDFNKDLNIKKKKEIGHFQNKKIHRCLLHSKKPILNKNLYSIIENNINEFDDYIQIEEIHFLKTLNNYLKKRRFCNTCQENIIFAYEQLKENADSPDSLSEKEVLSEPELYRVENKKILKENFDKRPGSESLEFHCHCKCHLIENYDNCSCNCDEQLSSFSDIKNNDEDECEKIDILSIIKFCDQNKTIVFPAQVEIMKEFLSRSETDFSNHTRHTLSRESAQEELLVCLGLTLKDKLQNHWKTRKNEEIIKLMFYNISANCIIENINYCYNQKISQKNHKEMLEDYVNNEEKQKEKRKEKLKKKRNKNKEKKKNKNKKNNLTFSEDQDTNTAPSTAIKESKYLVRTNEFTPKKSNHLEFIEDIEMTEKEKEFLSAMGKESGDDEIVDLDLNFSEKLREDINIQRENFRKNLNQKFMELIQKK